MADSRGPTELPYYDLIDRLAKVGKAAFEYEAECEAYDTAPAEHRGELRDVQDAHHVVDGELAYLIKVLGDTRAKYQRWLQNVTDKSNERSK